MLSGYLKVLTGTNTRVGIAEGIQGACQVIAAFPAGFLSDRFRRDRALKSAAVLGQLAFVAMLLALYSEEVLGKKIGGQKKVEFILMCVGLGRRKETF